VKVPGLQNDEGILQPGHRLVDHPETLPALVEKASA
jgi:hypothetical protein